MPEVVELRIVADELRPILLGKTIISLNWKSNAKHKNLQKMLLPVVIKSVDSYGKKLIFNLSNGGQLVTSLLMTGWWSQFPDTNDSLEGIISDNKSNINLLNKKPTEWLIELAVGETKGRMSTITDRIYYRDVRRFGSLVYLDTDLDIKLYFKNVGPTMLADKQSDILSFDQWKSRIIPSGKRNTDTIADRLLDQSVVAGIGNYLRVEILYDARINPKRFPKDLTDYELETIRNSSYKVIRESYSFGGLTISDFISPSGKAGLFPVKIYGKSFDPEGRIVAKYKSKNNRSMHWVESYQF